MSGPGCDGALALVLHTHMPYVEGFGTWPFGEEWLFEAVATVYLPLLEVLDAAPGRVTLSLTPVLADQLAAPGCLERCLAFLREVRPASHAADLAVIEDPGVRAELERSARRYAAAADALEARELDLLGALAAHVRWTSAATHPVLPLLATDAGVRLQLETGRAAHRARFGSWGGGFWLPECAYAPWLDPLLAQAGVRATCVDLTDVLGRGSPAQLRPLRSPAGPLLVPIDRAAVELVWGRDGYPSRAPYRAYHRHTPHHHRPWAVDGAPYDPARAAEQVAADAEAFVGWVAERVCGGGLCVVALDTELLGHFWFEGPAWLEAVLAACEARGLPLVELDEALAAGVGGDPAPAPADLPVTSWGLPRTLATWSGPGAEGVAWRQRAAELRVMAADPPSGPRALRELLALQSSDWAFAIAHGTAPPYGRARIALHERGLGAALADPGMEPHLRWLAPYLAPLR